MAVPRPIIILSHFILAFGFFFFFGMKLLDLDFYHPCEGFWRPWEKVTVKQCYEELEGRIGQTSDKKYDEWIKQTKLEDKYRDM